MTYTKDSSGDSKRLETNPFENHDDRICMDKAKYNSKCYKCHSMIRKDIDNVRLGSSYQWEHVCCNSKSSSNRYGNPGTVNRREKNVRSANSNNSGTVEYCIACSDTEHWTDGFYGICFDCHDHKIQTASK
jgi:hypothetical protein